MEYHVLILLVTKKEKNEYERWLTERIKSAAIRLKQLKVLRKGDFNNSNNSGESLVTIKQWTGSLSNDSGSSDQLLLTMDSMVVSAMQFEELLSSENIPSSNTSHSNYSAHKQQQQLLNERKETFNIPKQYLLRFHKGLSIRIMNIAG